RCPLEWNSRTCQFEGVGGLLPRQASIAYEGTRQFQVLSGLPANYPAMSFILLFPQLERARTLPVLRVAVEFADAFGKFVSRHGIFVVHPAEIFSDSRTCLYC